MSTVAANLSTLYQFEKNIETGVNAILAARGLTAVRQRATGTLSTPRVETKLTISGNKTDHVGTLKNGQRRWDTWTGELHFKIVTNRINSESSHASYCGTVREVMHSIDNLNLPDWPLTYYGVLQTLEGSGDPSVEAGENQDITEIRFGLTWNVLKEAWTA